MSQKRASKRTGASISSIISPAIHQKGIKEIEALSRKLKMGHKKSEQIQGKKKIQITRMRMTKQKILQLLVIILYGNRSQPTALLLGISNLQHCAFLRQLLKIHVLLLWKQSLILLDFAFMMKTQIINVFLVRNWLNLEEVESLLSVLEGGRRILH